MRFYVADNTGYINEMLSFVFEDMGNYNWIFTDMVPHVFKNGIEVTDTIFEREKFYILGKELYSFLKEYEVLLIFGVVIAVEQTDRNVLKNIPDYPVIQDNEQYWKEDYHLTIPGSVMEIGFFDTACLIFASESEYNIKKFQKQFPTAILYSEYLEL
ncbi:hypothetical protein [Bacillus multifaciens]|uniref:hypothetical protein n=1 Tax=Bacillus multifaciens TaxID=3068506 RepID=UPI002740AF7C|nr:hypothetical protein [Bacillus sp. WLY-B-L8]MDP7978541.1 hypothetical protein [Bacillus sp. WLY-B-L8]